MGPYRAIILYSIGSHILIILPLLLVPSWALAIDPFVGPGPMPPGDTLPPGEGGRVDLVGMSIGKNKRKQNMGMYIYMLLAIWVGFGAVMR